MIKALMAAAVLTVGLASNAIASDADILREAQDRADIQQLMWNYVRALDSTNEEAYANVFTEDGQFGSGQRAAKGRDALKKMVADVKKGRADREAKGEKLAPMHHIITNSHIEFTGKDTARYFSYWMTVFGAVGQPNTEGAIAPRVAAVGRGVDDLVRVKGKWLIKVRNVAPQD